MNLAGRLTLGVDGGGLDVEQASDKRFSADIQAVYARWEEFTEWARGQKNVAGAKPIDESKLGAPAPRPAQLFAIGLNYRDHAVESGLKLPERPMVFTKFPACIAGPRDVITLPPGSVDFETELVAVVGKRAEQVKAAEVWKHIAGVTIGQDLSERELQLAGPPPQQFNMGKSFTGFAPLGPALVTPDEFANPDDIELGCSINGEEMQRSRTSKMIFSVPQIVEFLSSVLPLLPGDVIFTGTPSGIGWARNPKRLLGTKDELVTFATGIGEMRHTFVNRADRS